jgi:hypothetical protein
VTACVNWSTVSRTLEEAAPWVPCTAKNAFIMATAILAGSKGTTAPFLRMIWYWLNEDINADCAAPVVSVALTKGLTFVGLVAICIFL